MTALLSLAGALLLSAPPDAPAPPTCLFPLLAPLVRLEAERVEAMDARERPYYVHDPAVWPNDLSTLRRRYRDLADAPPLSDCERFPPREALADLLAFNRRHRDYLTTLAAADPRHNYSEAVADVDKRWTLYDAMRDARCEYLYVSVKRYALKRLRDELLGTEAYFTGTLPPVVPVARFRPAD